MHYPDLRPPAGWVAGKQASQIRLVPPGETLATADVAIIVSPLVARQESLPPPAHLIEEAIFQEARLRLEVTAQRGPSPDKTSGGLAGVAFEIEGYVRPRSAPERRIYVMYFDSLCYYGINYLARASVFATHVETFWAAARSIRAFKGRVVAPTAQSPVATLYAD